MKVLLDLRPIMRPSFGGVGVYTRRITDMLIARRRHEYSLFSNAWERTPVLAFGAAEEHLRRLPNKVLNSAFAFLGRPRIEYLCGGADAVYLPNLNFVATGRPLVVTVHDLSFIRYPDFFSPKTRLWHRAIRPAGLLRQAAAIAAVSEHTKSDIVEMFGIAPERIAVVSPGVTPGMAPANVGALADVRRAFGLERPFFLYLGVIEPRKNISGLISAFDKIEADADLVIAGARGWLCDHVFAQAEASKKRGRIRFLGPVPEEQKAALLSAALALVYPSFYEGFGLPLLEAMACGTPVISGLGSSMGEVVADAGLLVDPNDLREIADAMQAVGADETLRAELTRRGLERAKKFSWEKSAEVLEKIFARL
ncbi:MAG: glycosyltransferase family 1 protein [Patescibacteria group bacterium]